MAVGCSPTVSEVTPGIVGLVLMTMDRVKSMAATSPVWIWVTAPSNWALTPVAKTASLVQIEAGRKPLKSYMLPLV